MAKAVNDKPEYRIGLSDIYISVDDNNDNWYSEALKIVHPQRKEVAYVLTWVIPMEETVVVGVFSSYSAAKAAVRQVAEKIIDELNEMWHGEDEDQSQTEDNLHFKIVETNFFGN